MYNRNAEGYYDPTAGKAISKVRGEEKAVERKIKEMMDHFVYVAGLNGFRIENRIVFKDVVTGKEYR